VQLVQGDRGVWFASADWQGASAEPDEQHRFGPLSSRYSVRALGALARLLAGEAASDARRAAVVGAPARWAPDPGSFEQGFALLVERHQAALSSSLPPREQALRLARSLVGLVPEEPEEPEGEPAPVKVWDGPRVRRHLERALGQAYQVLRRAAWLCLLANSSVAYREPGSSVTRFLVLHGTEIVESGDLLQNVELPLPRALERLETQLRFDAASYDSLRILSTELKRILRDGGDVTVRLSRSRSLRGAQLAGVLRVT
jgi:hypothetical protein